MCTKNLLLVILLVFAFPGILHASSCVPDALVSYYSLASGCTIGGVLFSDFRAFVTPNGSIAIDPNSILVTPINTPGNPGFQFTIDITAGAGEFYDIAFGFQVTANSIDGLSASMLGTSASGDGVLTTIEDFCLGGQFPFDQTICSGGTPGTLILFQTDFDSLLSDGTTFTPVTTLGVVKDIGIDGGLSGTSSIHSLTDQFHVPEPSNVPEPGSIVLLTTGFVALAGRRFRKPKA